MSIEFTYCTVRGHLVLYHLSPCLIEYKMLKKKAECAERTAPAAASA
jgi:hypothetical protein